jgi:asparagine synthase (glutamine-hydrolysing)
MCGIALIYNSGGQTPDDSCILRMTHALAHRGPDALATLPRGPVSLGHARLSIVDIAGGAQPMVSSDTRHAIVFNGEIYNYRELRAELELQGIQFHSASDTEVILHLYRRDGAQCVTKLRGMFAFAIHDAETQNLFMARDRVGIKPLFYSWDGSTLLAASEIKSLFASGLVEPKLDLASIRSYFTYQFAITPHTPFEGVLELPPGYTLTLAPNGKPVLHQYWDLDFPREGEYETLDEAFWTNEFQSAMEQATATHTIGEVPIGAYLSAGIDSSALTWLLTRAYDRPVRTFSIRFPDNDLDESPVYRNIAQHLQVENTEISLTVDGERNYVNELAQAMYHLEQPQRMALDVPYFMLSGLVREQNYKVVYTGDGADEILGGYDCYRQDYMRLWGNDVQDPALRQLLYFTQFWQNFSEPYIQLMYEQHAGENQQRVKDRFGCYPVWYDFWQTTNDMLPGLFANDVAPAADAQMANLAAEMKPNLEGRHRLNQSLYIETKTRLPGWILWRSDRMSMAHSVEARVPFLDHPLIELAARIPPDLKLNGMNEKYLLKKIAMPHLPQHPWQFKKKAFYTPIREWFFLPQHAEALEEYINTAALQDAGIFEVDRVNDIRNRLYTTKAPTNMNEYYHLMKLEWIMTLVLSVQMLHVQFVRKQGACFAPLTGNVCSV